MDDDDFTPLGNDGERLPRKRKLQEPGIIMLIVGIALLSALASSIPVYLFTLTLNSATEPVPPTPVIVVITPLGFETTLEALQSTQAALVNVTDPPDYLSTEAALGQLQTALAVPTSTPTLTPLPPSMCFCDNPGCLGGTTTLQRGQSMNVQASDAEQFGWYLVRNVYAGGTEWLLYPSDYIYTCDIPYDFCFIYGFYNSHECALSQSRPFCLGDPTCRIIEPTLTP